MGEEAVQMVSIISHKNFVFFCLIVPNAMSSAAAAAGRSKGRGDEIGGSQALSLSSDRIVGGSSLQWVCKENRKVYYENQRCSFM